jgi:hypothetical protein
LSGSSSSSPLCSVVGGTLVLPVEEADSVVALGSDEAAVVTGILVELLLVASAVGKVSAHRRGLSSVWSGDNG